MFNVYLMFCRLITDELKQYLLRFKSLISNDYPYLIVFTTVHIETNKKYVDMKTQEEK